MNSRISREKETLLEDKDNAQHSITNNTVAGKIIHHENSLSVNSLNVKKDDIPSSISTVTKEERDNEVRIKTQIILVLVPTS